MHMGNKSTNCNYGDVCNIQCMLLTYAMVTNHLRAPYGIFFTKNRTILRRPAGDRKNRTIFDQFFRHRTVQFRHYLKFHCACTAFGRVIEGKMTSAGHHTAPGQRLHTLDRHRAIFVWNSNCTIPTVPVQALYDAWPCIVWCLTSAETFKKFIYRRRPAPVGYVTTQEKILKNRPVPGRLSNSLVMCKSLKS